MPRDGVRQARAQHHELVLLLSVRSAHRTPHGLMEVPATGRTDLYAKLQKNFDSIFPTTGVTSMDVVRNMDKVLNG